MTTKLRTSKVSADWRHNERTALVRAIGKRCFWLNEQLNPDIKFYLQRLDFRDMSGLFRRRAEVCGSGGALVAVDVVKIPEQIEGVHCGLHKPQPGKNASFVRPGTVIRLLHHQLCNCIMACQETKSTMLENFSEGHLCRSLHCIPL